MSKVEDPEIVIPLEDPIFFGGEKITKLELRKPDAGDLFRVGCPVKIISFDPFSIDFDHTKMFQMMSRLSGYPIEGTLDAMSTNDSLSGFYALAPFFIPGGRSMRAPEQPAS